MADAGEYEMLLSEYFSIYPHKKLLEVRLLRSGIYVKNSTSHSSKEYACKVDFREAVGCHCMRSRSSYERTAYFTVYCYPPKKRGRHTPGKGRRRSLVTFGCSNEAEYQKNEEIANKWRIAVLSAMRTVHTGRGKFQK